jgi:hypothetical protein
MLALERRFRVYLEERDDTIWDTRFVRPRAPEGGRRPVVFVLLDGWHEWHAQSVTMPAPAVFVASQDVTDGLRGAEFARTAGGSPCRTVQLRLLDGPDLVDEGPRRIDDARGIIEAARMISASADADLRSSVATFLQACADAGVRREGSKRPSPRSSHATSRASGLRSTRVICCSRASPRSKAWRTSPASPRATPPA